MSCFSVRGPPLTDDCALPTRTALHTQQRRVHPVPSHLIGLRPGPGRGEGALHAFGHRNDAGMHLA